MRKLKKNKLLLLLLLLFPLSVESQTHDPTVVRFVNTGKMHVAANAIATALYIPDGVLSEGYSSIVQNGVTAIGGNFYQNAKTKAFTLGPDSFTVGSGKIKFMTASASGTRREIAVWPAGKSIPAVYTVGDPSASDFFKRSDYYVAFPNIEIATSDTIHAAPIMGLDAINITRTVAGGALYLESDQVGSDQIFDASLRVTGTLVDAGAVVIEKYVLPFRNSDTGNAYLFPFASPYTNQRAGYFAGNWVRAPRADADGHYAYPYANQKDAVQDYIVESQYVRWADDYLEAKDPYLLRLQPDGYSYDLPFVITSGEDHDLEKFIFNGTPFNLPFDAEQKMTGELFNRKPAVAGKKYQWLIGNSYTSAISIDSLVSAMDDSDIAFSKYLYVYPHGAVTYKSYDLNGDVSKIPNIPPMSVFMLIVSQNNTSTDSFVITPNMQVHGKGIADNGSGALLSPVQSNTHLTFQLTPENNPFIYDQTQIVLQSNLQANSDIAKSLNPTSDYFQLYGGSATLPLEKNGLPESTSDTPLLVAPPKFALSGRLTVSGIETLTTETLLLHDSKLNVWTNLLEAEDYVFLSEPTDNLSRFRVYFKTPQGINQVPTEEVYAYCQNDYLFLNRLTDAYSGAKLSIYNTSGLLVQEVTIDSYPRYQTPVSFPAGVYVGKISGRENTVVKFIKR